MRMSRRRISAPIRSWLRSSPCQTTKRRSSAASSSISPRSTGTARNISRPVSAKPNSSPRSPPIRARLEALEDENKALRDELAAISAGRKSRNGDAERLKQKDGVQDQDRQSAERIAATLVRRLLAKAPIMSLRRVNRISATTGAEQGDAQHDLADDQRVGRVDAERDDHECRHDRHQPADQTGMRKPTKPCMIICPAIVPTTELEIPEAISDVRNEPAAPGRAAAPSSCTRSRFRRRRCDRHGMR